MYGWQGRRYHIRTRRSRFLSSGNLKKPNCVDSEFVGGCRGRRLRCILDFETILCLLIITSNEFNQPSGAASIEWYHRWVETRDVAIRQRIFDYNEDDCTAMRVLLDAVQKLPIKMIEFRITFKSF